LIVNAVRTHFGISQVIGAFDSSANDPSIDERLLPLMGGSKRHQKLNTFLSAAVQQETADANSLVIDSVHAAPYLPVGLAGPTIYFAQSILSAAAKIKGGFFTRRSREKVQEAELKWLQRLNHIFTTPQVESDLFSLPLPHEKLIDQRALSKRGMPFSISSGFSETELRIGYFGYLADESNVASLRWFLETIWGPISKKIPELEFHIVGSDSTPAVIQMVDRLPGVFLHRDAKDKLLFDLGCRVVIEPLLHETHVEAKLINAMARGIPVVTTREAVTRSNWVVGDAVAVATSPSDMLQTLRQLLSDETLWESRSKSAQQAAERVYAFHEVAHAIRRLIKVN
jgi:glycosyltransferase involved in cell wall biosynthesis